MPSRYPPQCQSGRKHSLGKLRRAHPASGASWNVQVVRGKMTSKCLWHACRALALGMTLMFLGAGMATIGYYANHISPGHEVRSNATVRIRNESRGIHLNNLSYVGPIVMGFGGFIVVAACVMTFEARDSAGKVVPARFKATGSGRSNTRSNNSSSTSNRRANGIPYKSSRWEHHAGIFRTSPAEHQPPPQLDRKALTAALIHFSKTIGTSPRLSPRQSPRQRRISRSGSVPNLASSPRINLIQLSPHRKQLIYDQTSNSHRHLHHHHHQSHGRRLSKSRSSRISSSLVHRESSSSLLHPGILQLQRHALSVDESGPYFRTTADNTLLNSLTSVVANAADSHEARLRDRTKRSDTSRRHILARQKPIEKDEPHSPKSISSFERRRSSATSDASRQTNYRRTSSASRTPSIDSRSVQVELHSPEIDRVSPRTPRRFNSGQSSTPSVEREFRSQLSICSEPITIRQLSCQSSLEPCVLEESPDFEEKDASEAIQQISPVTSRKQSEIINYIPPPTTHSKKPRPDHLQLKHSNVISGETRKLLQRSNSSRTFYRPKPKPIGEYDQIYFINSGRTTNHQDDFYDSLRVINERRNTILKSSASNSNEVIAEIDHVLIHESSSSLSSTIPKQVNNKINNLHKTQEEITSEGNLEGGGEKRTVTEIPGNLELVEKTDTSPTSMSTQVICSDIEVNKIIKEVVVTVEVEDDKECCSERDMPINTETIIIIEKEEESNSTIN